ncbi:hypothetical protein H0H92_011928 [Tricholoma furcatifolium]|nr:hypothetical protein H0H92_011928 [Tricholoma furcatifolium]
MFSLFEDSPEYKKRIKTPFSPTKVMVSLSEVHSAVPKHLHEKNTGKSLLYIFRDLACAFVVYKLGWLIDPVASLLVQNYGVSETVGTASKWTLWVLYWYWQGIILAGWWCMAHEAGHGSLSDYNWFNHVVGFTFHTFLFVPYFAWRSTHHAHHKAVNSVERDENYIPRTRSDYNLPPEKSAHVANYHDVFEETPIYTLIRMLVMLLLGLQTYLLTNVMGSPRHSTGTSHFLPSSSLFKPRERNNIILSNLGITFMVFILYLWTQEVGFHYFIKLYFVPYIIMTLKLLLQLTNNWVIMFTYIQHSDPAIPHYRNKGWTFLRGALSTVDRPFLGWIGHNQPYVTEAIKNVLKDDYNYDSTNTLRAMYRSFTQCCFVEDDGDIVFYKNKDGKAARVLKSDAVDLNDDTKSA